MVYFIGVKAMVHGVFIASLTLTSKVMFVDEDMW